MDLLELDPLRLHLLVDAVDVLEAATHLALEPSLDELGGDERAHVIDVLLANGYPITLVRNLRLSSNAFIPSSKLRNAGDGRGREC